jgi:hypothetical protein
VAAARKTARTTCNLSCRKTRNRMASKAFWDKPNPKKKGKALTAAQKAAAKRRAKAAGRPYPNLVDNAAVRRKRG